MKSHKIKTLLCMTILVMTVMPLAAAFYFLARSLQASLNLGSNSACDGRTCIGAWRC